MNHNLNDWSNLKILHRNRLPSRTYFLPYASPEEALSGADCNIEVSPNLRVESLSGSWGFEWMESPLLVNQDMLESPPNPAKTIELPSNWQFSGYGQFHYVDMDYPFPVDPPHIPAKNETGVYKRIFSVNSLSDNRLFVRFEGVESAFHLYINHKLVGYSQGSRMPSEFELTDFIHEGENTICVVVYQYCDGSYLEAQDMWWLGGITRDVMLMYRPTNYLKNLILDPDYDLNTKEGILNVRAEFSSADLELQVWDETACILAKDQLEQNCQLRIPDAETWTAERPHQYKVLAILRDESGEILECTAFPIGFRHISIENGVLKLNGQRIFLKGFNRHEFNPKVGRAVGREETYVELALIKQAGFNAIRCSHYPNQPFFYEFCGALGLYVIDECDLETHGLEPVHLENSLANDQAWKEAYLDRIERMVERDRNFACVILWSLGNESGYGNNFKEMYNWCKDYEPTRPVHYEGDFKNQSVDVSSTMYTTIGNLAELDYQKNPLRPHILCEFAHGMGNGPGSMEEYFETVYTSRRIQGLFAWEFKDHGIYKKTDDGFETYLYGGDFGEKYHNRNFCLDGFIAADKTILPSFYEYQAVASSVHIINADVDSLKFTIQNRWDFTNLNTVEVHYSFILEESTVKSGVLNLPNVAPHEIGTFQILDEIPSGEKVLWIELDFHSIASFGVAKSDIKPGQYISSKRFQVRDEDISPISLIGGADVSESSSTLLVFGESFQLEISKVDGSIRNYTSNGTNMMPQGPRLNLFRAYTDNDVKYQPEWEKNHLGSLCYTVKSFEWNRDKTGVHIDASVHASPGGIAWGVHQNIHYDIGFDGSLYMHTKGEFIGVGIPHNLPKIGTNAKLIKDINQVIYRGFGPNENYCDSQSAAMDGIWSNAPENLEVEYLYPQENGNRSCTKWVAIEAKENTVIFASSIPLDFSLRSHSDENLFKSQHRTELKSKLKSEKYWTLNLDYQNAGLGSASCGPVPLNHHQVYPLPFAWNMSIIVQKAGETTADAANRAMGIAMSKTSYS